MDACCILRDMPLKTGWRLSVLIAFFAVAPQTALLLTPDAPEMNRRAPEQFKVRLETTKGNIVVEIRREWAPIGVDHFYNLVRAGYYDQSRFFRVVKDRWTQFGIN
jgi:cyclophilin type peptidyl-prolyl cis-trans isomerase/CLD